MSLALMSFYGAVLTIVIIMLRALAINRLPKRAFLVLWSVVLIRLLVPFEITSAYSVYSFTGHDIKDALAAVQSMALPHGGESAQMPEVSDGSATMQPSEAPGAYTATSQPEMTGGNVLSETANPTDNMENGTKSHIWMIIWGTGAALCALFFMIAYVSCRMEFGMSLPINHDYISQWTAKRKHSVSIRVFDRIDAPLTYGILHPVILLPKKMEWEDQASLEYVLWHEYTHICYGDNVLKLIMVTALCIHWFNPLVWGMYFLFNRDIELACDESVVRRCGVSNKSAYANMLIRMEAKRSGLMPLCNNFSQNAIEERVRAIMKVKNISLAAVIFAAGLVVGVTMAFATSAAGDTEQQTGELTNISQEEYDKLLALQFDDYENMTVSEFQNRVWTITDTAEYRDLLDRLSMNEAFYENRDVDDMAYFMFYVLEPLTAERWQKRDFSGCVSAGHPDTPKDDSWDMAILEYVMTLTILDADKLTVGEYINTRSGMAEAIKDNIFPIEYSARELVDEESMQTAVRDTMAALTEELSTDELQVDVEYVYQPLEALYVNETYVDEEYQKERLEQYEAVLKPYMPFGLTYDYDARTDECKMYFQGKEVRGIMDEEQDTWITKHAGIGENIYAKDAIELFAVYENGKLAGLRAATEEEQAEFDLRRQMTTYGYNDFNEEVREYLPGTKEDYQSVLSLKKADYEQMTLADFNRELLEWGNEHSESYDRISCDTIWNDFRVDLSDKDKEFIVRTVSLSGSENGMAVRSQYTGKPEEDVALADDLTKTPDGEEAAYVWCHMYYGFSYHISDKENVTVEERDRCVGSMLEGIQEFWDQTDIEDILKMDKADIIKKLNELARNYSTDNVTITVSAEDQIGFECMDERGRLKEM